MKLEIIKRFEFAAAHKYWDTTLSEDENFKKFGKDSLGKFGHGHNFIVFLYFTGPINPKTGMIMELSDVKNRVLTHVLTHVDHRYLNDLPAFQNELPTPIAIAKYILQKTQTTFENTPIKPTECHLIETALSKAIVTPTSEHHFTQLNATHSDSHTQTFRIHATHCLTNTELSETEHDTIFGKCQFVHGHEFEVEITTAPHPQLILEDQYKKIENALEDWQYKSLNDEVPELQNKLCSCETIIQVLYDKLSKISPVPITQLVLKETPNNAFRLTT